MGFSGHSKSKAIMGEETNSLLLKTTVVTSQSGLVRLRDAMVLHNKGHLIHVLAEHKLESDSLFCVEFLLPCDLFSRPYMNKSE